MIQTRGGGVTLKEQVKPFLEFLKDRFKSKIKPEEYYLAYSGGKDSHFIWWFIKEYLHDDKIKIVGVNTSFEIPEIRDRILKNSDIVLHPSRNRWWIKDNFGIPCYSKQQDEFIYRYQHGSRSDNTMKYIMGQNPVLNLNAKARDKLLSGQLHPISNKCCYYNKELPLIQYGKQTGRKAIMGVRQSESLLRKSRYNTCLSNKGDFRPIYDFTDTLLDDIYKAYNIEIPKCYTYVSRTGCAGCPYGRNCEKELAILPELQKKQVIKYFKESYDVKGINYYFLQQVLSFRNDR